jgi:oxalate decarboxylase/phosphoglucose isomerase-like protein (cupin superfamily)
MVPLANAQQEKPVRSADHSQPNEVQPGENNAPLDAENPSSVWSPETDNGTVEPFKYSFSLAHKRIENGGWTRQVTARELPISKTLAGVEMRLVTGGVRELHWHTSAEWAFMIYGNARITAVDAQGRSFVNDVTAGDLWLFPGGIPHSVEKKNFSATDIAAGIARVKPGGMRELHWHPLSDEWQYYVSGKGRMTVFQAGGKARTFDFQAGDVGYIKMSRPHYVENTGTEDLVFLEVFPIGTYQDISAAEWLAHTPARLVDQHIKTGEDFLNKISKQEAVVTPI